MQDLVVGTMDASSPRHRVVMVIHPDVAATDVTGPMEAFGLADHLSGSNFYELMTATLDGQPVQTTGGYMQLMPTHSFASLPDRIDTLMFAGGPNARSIAQDRAIMTGLRTLTPRSGRIASVCNGAHILCATGLTKGHSVATHWFEVDDLRRLYPDTLVDGDAVFIHSGNIWSSAGMTTGIDLALAMIEADLGRQLALEVACHMVLYLKRPGGQSQFSMHLQAQFAGEPSLERVQHFILDNLHKSLSVEELASVARISSRTLHRAFRDKTGKSIGDFVVDARLRHACNLLTETGKGLKAVATLSGLGSDTNLRRVFMRRLGISPTAYRERFQVNPLEPENGGAHSALAANPSRRCEAEGSNPEGQDSGPQSARTDQHRASATVN